MSGCLIVLEGIDGSGKGTQLNLLQQHLEQLGKTVYITHEPSQGAIGRLIREELSSTSTTDEATMALLFAADRLQHIRDMQAHLDAGEIVLCDRYILSSLAYNSQQLTLEWVCDINKEADRRLHPAITLLFDLPEQAAMHRIDVRGDVKERYETQQQLYQIRDMYRMLAEVRHDDNVVLINANQAPDAVHEDVWQAIQSLL